MAAFNFTTDVGVRYSDIDSMGHVNNAVYATYCEQARMEYLAEVLGVSGADPGMVLAHLELDYERPIVLEDDVTVAVAVTAVGRSSFQMLHEVRANDDVAASATSTQVVVDPETKKPTPIPDEWRRQLVEFEGLDE
jgi:acyl-CoA thioester hydrolase